MTSPAGGWNILPLYLDSVVYPDWHPRTGEIGPVYAYLLESDDYLFLVDTGIGPPHEVIDRLYTPTRRDLPTALAQNNGILLEDITAVIITHLHFDHVGGAQHFRGTPMFVQRSEWEASQSPKYTIPEWLEFPGANFHLLDGDTELAPGLHVFTTPGHTPGHQSVAFETAEGLMVIAGQAIETKAELETMLATDTPSDAAKRILELKPMRVWFSHDHESWEPGP